MFGIAVVIMESQLGGCITRVGLPDPATRPTRSGSSYALTTLSPEGPNACSVIMENENYHRYVTEYMTIAKTRVLAREI